MDSLNGCRMVRCFFVQTPPRSSCFCLAKVYAEDADDLAQLKQQQARREGEVEQRQMQETKHVKPIMSAKPAPPVALTAQDLGLARRATPGSFSSSYDVSVPVVPQYVGRKQSFGVS